MTGKQTLTIPPAQSSREPANDYDHEHVSKKARSSVADMDWVKQLAAEAHTEEKENLELFTAMDSTEQFLRIELDVGDLSNRQRKLLERNPVSFMIKKLRDSEVVISKLPPHERPFLPRQD